MRTLKTAAKVTKTQRDPMKTFLFWTWIGSLTLLAACISVLSPLAYLWLMGILGIAATLATTLGLAGAMCGDSFVGAIFAGDVVKFGFELIGAILGGLLDASK